MPVTTPPDSRRLRVFAFDPALATRLETWVINEITLDIRWEELKTGPVGEYLEVVDFDPASKVFYRPVDLNEPWVLAQDGVIPSESNPHFHQQMVYAVAMTTIRQFERALGRVAFWSDRITKTDDGKYREQFVRRLRIFPHALRERNAYYSPQKKAVLFGYFPITAEDKHNTPGTLVFTCLSHDIIAHEVTHALLDGVHPRFNEPTNPDVHAFHEAFADIVALFQHFSYPAVLASQIARTRGALDTENLLSQLAQQFGRATGRGSALRDALGSINPKTEKWEAATPDPYRLRKTLSPHERGSILVAAVFRAFLLLYRARVADLIRIATNGTGVLPEGHLHPDLVKRLAREAAEIADRILQMCIRAIDYCPPVDITFGDYLRGIVTADVDYSPSDDRSNRIAFIESFREWGIHPRGLTSMGLDELLWPSGDARMATLAAEWSLGDALPSSSQVERLRVGREAFKQGFLKNQLEWTLESDRFEAWKQMDKASEQLWRWLRDEGDSYGKDYAHLFGLVTEDWDAPPSVYRGNDGRPTVEIHAVRPAIRRTPYGSPKTHLIVEITQRRRGYFDPEKQARIDTGAEPIVGQPDFKYRAGCTILIDPATQKIHRIMCTAGNIVDNNHLARVRSYLTGETGDPSGNAFDAGLADSLNAAGPRERREPFALLHQEAEDE